MQILNAHRASPIISIIVNVLYLILIDKTSLETLQRTNIQPDHS